MYALHFTRTHTHSLDFRKQFAAAVAVVIVIAVMDTIKSIIAQSNETRKNQFIERHFNPKRGSERVNPFAIPLN